MCDSSLEYYERKEPHLEEVVLIRQELAQHKEAVKLLFRSCIILRAPLRKRCYCHRDGRDDVLNLHPADVFR